MKRLALGLFVILANLGVAKVSLAQDTEANATDKAGGDNGNLKLAGHVHIYFRSPGSRTLRI